ncbi:MAG TPA: prephenate dehydrogenase/arogenate dehydrogenase family protein [Dehalococcoidia bacterium]|nr:prephenate dehydrogenase/arogenate dehydrogenase family protein [Dehalococcoidia bacterium]
MERVTIIGTGLIGGSIGLGLKASQLPGVEVVGYDDSSSALATARKQGAIDISARSIGDAVDGARMVIIATPALAARSILQDIAGRLAEGAIVTDTLSTKAEIMHWAREYLPDNVSYVGGHPMAGKATSAGAAESEATLFHGRSYCIVPSPDASDGAVQSVVGLANLLGAQPVFMHAEEHDQYVAAISHLPMMVSYALFSLARESAAWQDMRLLASTGFAGATRLASGDPQMTHDICVTNGEALIHWIDRFIEELRRYRGMIADDPGELFKALAGAQLKRDAFLAGADKPEREQMDLPSASEQMSTILFGGFLTSRYQEYEKRMRESEERNRR